jgi:hypothetical protein
MATIKLQPSGAVVMKDGKVACACCVDCGCNTVLIPQALRPLFEAATINSITMWGYSPYTLYQTSPEAGYPEGTWIAEWFVTEEVFIDATLIYLPYGCLYSDVNIYQSNPDTISYVTFGEIENCAPYQAVPGTFTINGTGGFLWYYAVGELTVPSPPPNIVVS